MLGHIYYCGAERATHTYTETHTYRLIYDDMQQRQQIKREKERKAKRAKAFALGSYPTTRAGECEKKAY